MDRLGGAMAGDTTIAISDSPDENVHLCDLSIFLHDGNVMIEGDDAIIPPGEKVLVQDESGEGRSMLIRAMAGLWPWDRGKCFSPVARNRYSCRNAPIFHRARCAMS